MPLSKAPSQNIFSLDPVKTTLTAPTTNVQVQGPENRSRANAQFARGLQGFATSLGNLGNLAKERQRTADIKLAEEAAIRGDTRPDSVFKEADDAFDNINDANTSWEVIRNIKEWEDGPDGHNLINSQGALSTNHTATHNVYDGFESTGVSQIANPILKAKLSEQIRARRDEVKKLQFGVDQERKQNVASIAVRNEVEELIAGTGSDNPLDEIDLKGSIRSMALEYARLDIGVDKDEAALIVAQMFLLNEDVKSDPEFGINILESEFSKDVPFQALLSKGLNPLNTDPHGLNTDPHGKAFAEIYTKFLTDADKEQRDAIAQEKLDAATNKDEALKSVYAQFADMTTSRGMAAALVAKGFFEEPEANKIAEARQKLIDTEVKFQEGDQPYLDAVELILSQHPNFQRESDIDRLIDEGFMNPKVKPSLMTHLKEEGKQKERHIKAFKDSVSTVISNALSLSKITLKNKNALADLIAAPDKELSQVDFQSRIFALLRPGLTNPDELRIVVDRLQDLRNDINKEAYKRGVISSKLDRENGEVDPLTLEQFQTGYVQPSVRALVDAIDAGLPETRIVQAPVEVPMTADDYPLIVKQDDNIFSKDQPGGASNISPSFSATGIVKQDADIFSKDQPGGASNISPSSPSTGAVTFSSKDSPLFNSVISENNTYGFPFKATQNEVIDLKALVRDATLNNFSTPLASMVEDLAFKEVERHNKLEEAKKALTPEGQRKGRREKTRAESKQFASDLQENLRLLPGFVLDLVTPTPETIKVIKEALDPENISSILPDGPTPEERKKALEERAEKKKAVHQFNEDFKDFFSIKGLVDLVGEIVTFGDSKGESASTSQDPDFKDDQSGPRGFDKDNQPIEGTRNELAKELGLPPDLSEDKFKGGTSEESDIEGFTGEEVDMPPVDENKTVIEKIIKQFGEGTLFSPPSPKDVPRIAEALSTIKKLISPNDKSKDTEMSLSELPKETQEDIKRQLKNMRQVTTSKIQRDRDAVIKKAELGNIDKIKYGTKPYLSYASWKALGKPARALTNQNQLPPSSSNSVKSGATIGYGHDILKSELGSGKIHGVSFLNRDGTFKNLTEKQLDIIFQEDIKIAEKETNKSYSNKRSQLPNLPKFETLPNTVQIYLTDMGFNIGASKFIKTYPKGLGALEALNMIKTNPNIKPTTNNRLQEIITLSQQSTVGGAISWNNTDMTKNRKRLLEVFKAEITDRGASPAGVKKRAKDLWESLPIETDLFERFGK